ncbi:kelch-like protein 10 [Centruroides sculpturatus]|uniref:kelch-like protein 10 n=1 Tax=Centruroides sculpturatus TaxID=218467 RepID=UPI000C6DBE7C|nr:kelch-like protein 10 [Centruroides sculpturatus]XP_023236298.1 kelch-like protein 10 [Centruroides sculpturatus]
MSSKVGRTFSQNSLNIMKKMKDSGIFCDVILKTEGEKFPVHKCIMAANSYFFEILFINTTDGDKRKEVPLEDIDKETLQHIIDYLYCGKIELNSENVQKIFVAADEYLFSELMEECCSYMIHHLDSKNCISIKNIGKYYRNITLEKSAHQYLMKNYVEVSSQNEELMEMTTEELINVLNCEELNVKEEELVWDTVLRWININPQERKKHMPDLLKCIRLGLLDSDFFMRTVKTHPYVTENEDCYPLITETLKFLNDLETISQRSEEILTPDLALPRIPHEIIFAIGGWSSGSPTDYIETYDSRADRWVKMNEVDPAGPRAYHRCAVIDHNIYIIGGFDGTNHYSGCRCLDTIEKQWKEIAPMHCRRCYVSVAVLDNLIYAMGGYNGMHRHNTAERYDRRTNQWTMMAPMHMQRSDADATTLGGFIYIIGGFTGQQCLDSAERYNPQSNQWTLISNMSSRRSGVSCIAFNDCVYTLGGFNGLERLQTVEKYNPRNDTWSEVPDMATSRSNFAVEVIDDMIFAIGGYNGESIICRVECYSEATNQWYEATDMNIFRSALAACRINQIPNITDYIHKYREKLLEEKRQRLLELREMETELD